MIKDLLNSRPVVLGRIKIGMKGEKHPEKFDHFKVFKPDKDTAGQPVIDEGFQEMLERKYGKPLRRLPIYFLSNTLDANFDSSYAYYKKYEDRAVCVCKGDGEKAARVKIQKKAGRNDYEIIKDAQGRFVYEPVPCPCDKFNPSLEVDQKLYPCKWAGKIAFMLADYPKGGGYFLFRTHSMNSLRNIYFALKQFESITFGNMAGIPVDMVLEAQKNAKGMTIFVVRIEWSFDPKTIRLKAIEEVRSVAHLKAEIAKAEDDSRKLLVAADQDEDIADEFYPESTDEPKSDAKIDGQTATSKPTAEEKLSELLTPGKPTESTAERLNRERAEEKAAQPASPAPQAIPSQTAQAAPGAPKKRGRKPKVQQSDLGLLPPAQTVTVPAVQSVTPAPTAPAPAVAPSEPTTVPDVTNPPQKQQSQSEEDVNARFF